MVLNIVMVGFFTAVTQLLEADAVRKAVADSVPASFKELNLKAFEKGYEYGKAALAAGPEKLEVEHDAVLSQEAQ
jgi:2-oxoglutarate ferredoxin oxidoreductase subunit gamma